VNFSRILKFEILGHDTRPSSAARDVFVAALGSMSLGADWFFLVAPSWPALSLSPPDLKLLLILLVCSASEREPTLSWLIGLFLKESLACSSLIRVSVRVAWLHFWLPTTAAVKSVHESSLCCENNRECFQSRVVWVMFPRVWLLIFVGGSRSCSWAIGSKARVLLVSCRAFMVDSRSRTEGVQ
jgi:hypothetical protein